MKIVKNILPALFILIFALGLYVATVRGIPGNPKETDIKGNLDQAAMPLELSPERGRYVLVMSLAEHGSFALNDTLANAADPDVGYHDGKFYIYFGPGISVLALPLYHLGKQFNLAQVSTFFTVSIVATLNLLLLYLISLQIFKTKRWVAVAVALIFGFGCTAWSYANTLYQHQITTFFILSSFYAVWQYSRVKRWSFLWAIYVWTAYGLSIFVDYPNAILILPIMVYFLIASFKSIKIDRKKVMVKLNLAILITSVVFIAISGVHAYYNYQNFGDWKKLSGSLVGIKEIRRYKLLENTKDDSKVKEQGKDKQVVAFFHEKDMPHGLTVLFGSRDRGLLLFSPIFLFGFIGIFLAYKKGITIEGAILCTTILTHIFLYSSWGDPWGGWAYGPRYLIPSMALLSIFIGIYLTRFPSLISRIFVFLLFVYSSAIGLLGAITTNAVPPKIEADYFKVKYNFLQNYDFLLDNHSSSYVYNTFFKPTTSLEMYFYTLWATVLIAFFITVCVIPTLERSHKK